MFGLFASTGSFNYSELSLGLIEMGK